MRGQIIYGNARLDVLKNIYAKELEKYMEEVSLPSAVKDDQLLSKRYNACKYNSKYADKLLNLYMEKCKLRHALAFAQFRKILPKAKISDLREMFLERLDYIIRNVDKCQELQKSHKKGEEIPEAPTLVTKKIKSKLENSEFDAGQLDKFIRVAMG